MPGCMRRGPDNIRVSAGISWDKIMSELVASCLHSYVLAAVGDLEAPTLWGLPRYSY